MSQSIKNTPISAATAHIAVTPGTCGGRARIAGHRIRVQDIVVWHERMSISADEIVGRYPQLTHADIYAALAYYYDHREQIDEQMKADEKLVAEVRSQFPSKLAAKLTADE